MIERLLMSRTFRRYIESWMVVLMPWVLFTEREGVTMDGMFPLSQIDESAELGLFELTPEEEQEMEDRRAVWADSPLHMSQGHDDCCKEPVWNEDDWRKSPTDEE